MPRTPREVIAESLESPADPDGPVVAELVELLYQELRALAASYFQGRHGTQTLQPTALVHEAFLRVTDRTGARFRDRAHFFAVCAVAMRGILADHARRRRAAKRGGDRQRVSLTSIATPTAGHPVDALALDEALTELARRSERQARIVEYRFFSGMSVEEIARVLAVSRSTVEEDWRMARAWLNRLLSQARTGE